MESPHPPTLHTTLQTQIKNKLVKKRMGHFFQEMEVHIHTSTERHFENLYFHFYTDQGIFRIWLFGQTFISG